jgi:hypothetical protein
MAGSINCPVPGQRPCFNLRVTFWNVEMGNRETLAASDLGCVIWMWDAAAGKQTRQIVKREGVGDLGLAFSPDGKTLISAGRPALLALEQKEGQIRLLDVPDLMDDALQTAAADLLAVGATIQRRGDFYQVQLRVQGRNTTDALAKIKDFRRPTALVLKDSENLTDEGLANLAECEQIKVLDLEGTGDVSDVGIAHLAGLTNIEDLNLTGLSRVTDGA